MLGKGKEEERSGKGRLIVEERAFITRPIWGEPAGYGRAYWQGPAGACSTWTDCELADGLHRTPLQALALLQCAPTANGQPGQCSLAGRATQDGPPPASITFSGSYARL